MRKISLGYILIGGFVCLALASIVGGIALVGTPAEQRLVALDNNRVGDLNQLGNAVRRYQTRNGNLPKSVAAISDEWLTELSDPETGEPYTYRVTGERSFQLCAVFAASAEPSRNRATYGRFKTYEQGLHCFDQTIERKSR